MRRMLPLAAFAIALSAMYAVLVSGPQADASAGLVLAVLSIAGIAFFSAYGLFEESFIRFAVISVIIQSGYFALDAATAFLLGKSIWFAILQFLNFGIAGLLFAVAVTLFYGAVGKERMRDYAGLYPNNRFTGVALAIACLALGGMPGFNIFVGEYVIYSSLFIVHPALAMAAVFASLVCFIFYFRICYVIFAGESVTRLKEGAVAKALMGALAALTILLGVVPQILLKVLEMSMLGWQA